MARNPGGTVSGFKLLSTPDAPTISSVTTSIGSASVAFTAPTDVGDAAVSSYVVTAVDESTGASTGATGSASPINLSLSSGTFKIRMQALNAYGPGRLTEYDTGNVVTYSGLSLFSWGSNGSGELGQNNTTLRSSPVQVGSLTTWRKIDSGALHSFAIKNDNTLWAWGRNTTAGALGIGTKINQSSPVQVGALTNWNQASAGWNNSSGAVKTDGTLWTWGSDGSGCLGKNTNGVNVSSPVQVGSLTDWTYVSFGGDWCLALKSNGTMWSWGSNSQGRLGQNIAATVSLSSPVQIGALTNWSSITSNYFNGMAATSAGTLFSWGSNTYGQNGDNTRINRSSPVQIGALTNWSQISAGRYHNAAVKTDGTLWSWGRNNVGQVGDGTVILRSSPVQVGALTDWAQCEAGGYFNSAIKTNGTLWSWGRNSSGQVGDNATDNRSSPVQVGALTAWYGIAPGESWSLALYGVV